MDECESITNYGSDSTAVMPEDCCPLCSNKYSYVYHQGQCPWSKEYHPDGTAKWFEFVGPSGTKIASRIETIPDFDADDLLRDILSHLQGIQRGRKGSIGSLNNTYLPQLRVDHMDELAARVNMRLAGLHQGTAETSPDFDMPLELTGSSTKLAQEVVIEEPTFLEAGRYTIVLGELFRIVDDVPPLDPLPLEVNYDKSEDAILVASGILQQLVDQALQESPSPDWERELDDL